MKHRVDGKKFHRRSPLGGQLERCIPRTKRLIPLRRGAEARNLRLVNEFGAREDEGREQLENLLGVLRGKICRLSG